ncbi:MAG: rRNA maturation RNAse YbeY, partial [Armatimonadetes bacterium]|nr:rRNA maturation RNAse YbeY [Armatimonadota bacterium]
RWTPQEELVLYLVHGLLHLVGYDDRSPMERRLMRQRERSIMRVVSCQLAVVR